MIRENSRFLVLRAKIDLKRKNGREAMIDYTIDFDNITFGVWLDFWYETYKKPLLKPYSVRNIEQVIRLHTPTWLKERRLDGLTVFDIDRALSSFKPSRTLVYVKQVWHNSLQKACRLGILGRNVVAYTDRIRYRKKKGNALTIREQTDFIERLDGMRVRWLMLFYLHTGVRRTEALTMEWKDIDEGEGLILVRGTKTEDSFRRILLTDEVKAILEGQRKQLAKDAGTKYESKHPERVFDYSAQYVSHAFKALCPNHCLHDLRHTYITRCAESGVNVTVCQQLVGHSTPQLTLGIYTHVMDEFKRREALKFSIYPYMG